MGGSQSSAINKNFFTSESAYNLVNQINTDINIEEKQKMDNQNSASVGDINFDNLDGMNVDISVQAKSTAALIAKYTNFFDAVSKADTENGVKLDALTGLINQSKQDGGLLDTNKSENINDQKFSIKTSVDNVTNIASSIVRMAEVSLTNKAELGNITITNAKNSNIRIEVVAQAESQAQSLSEMTMGFKNELENGTSTYLSTETDMSAESIQEGVVDNLADVADNVVDTVGETVNNAIDEAGETSRSFIKMLVIPACIVALIISLIVGIWLYKKMNSTSNINADDLATLSNALSKR